MSISTLIYQYCIFLFQTLLSFCFAVLFFSDSPLPWCHDRGWSPEAREAKGTLGDDARLPGLRRHGHVLLPRSPRQSGSHGLQVSAVPPGPGRPPSHPAGAVGLPGGHVPGAPGQTPPNRHGVRLCAGHAPLQSDGDGVALIQHLSDSDLHQQAQLEPLFLSLSWKTLLSFWLVL